MRVSNRAVFVGARLCLAVSLFVATGAEAAVSCGLTQWTETFTPLSNYRAPDDIVVADLNHDGHLDVAHLSAYFLGAGFGTGNGTFTSALAFPASSPRSFRSLAVADVNNDGYLDLLVTDYGTGNILVFLGSSTGFPTTPIEFAAPVMPYGIAAADFDGDGRADIAITSWEHSTVVIMKGDGTGHFTEIGTVDLPDIQVMKIVAGDFDGDGHADLAFTHYVSNMVDILFGRGDGTFENVVQATVGLYPDRSIVFADLDGDRHAELITGNWDDGTITVNPNLGGRSFGAAQAYPLTPPSLVPIDITVGDFNGDGRIDVAAANYNLNILAGRGDGTFDAATTPEIADQSGSTASPIRLRAGDFDEDGNLDLVDWHTGSVMYVALNRCGDVQMAASATPALISVGQQANVGVSLAGFGYQPPRPTGTVTFSDSGVVLGTATLNNGVGSASLTFTTPGTHTVTATYNGDSLYNSASTTVAQRVTSDTTALAITFSPVSPNVGDRLTVTIKLTATATGTPSGSITTMVDGQPGPTFNVSYYGSSPSYTLNTAFTAGTHTFSASYSGDTNFPPSSASATFTYAKVAPYLRLYPPYTPTTSPAYVNVQWMGASYGPQLAGTITLFVDKSAVQTLTLPASSSNITLPMSIGVHYVQAAYSGDSNYFAATTDTAVFRIVQTATLVLTAHAGPGPDPTWGQNCIYLWWNSVPGAYKWVVYRQDGLNGLPQQFPCYYCNTVPFFSNLTPGVVYVLQLEARDANDVVIARSNKTMAMIPTATLDTIFEGALVRAADFTATAARINSIRSAAGLPSFTSTASAGGLIQGSDLQQLRDKLDEARAVFGVPAVVYSASPAPPGLTIIRAADLQEVREATQ